jgi:3-hydroxyacyl-[acyl-carrier-protein] dehydratase
MVLDVVQIQAILPHRYPFLLVDRVEGFGEGNTIHARRLVSASDPILQGHFPGAPIVPGVLQVEAMAQAAILLAHRLGQFDPETQICFFMAIQEAKFRAPVVPGDVLDIHVTAERLGRIGKFSGEIRCADQVRSSAKFTAITEKRSAAPAV